MGDDVPTDGPAADLDACFAPFAWRHDLRRGCRSVGMALDPSRAALAQRRTKSHGVDQRGYHWLLYALLLFMPVTGYLQSADGRPVSYLGLFNLPELPKDKALGDVANVLHLLGQWGLYTLAGLHVGATVWHVAIRRDGLLSRMIPPQDQSGSFSDSN
jgi:cytochrome b561